MRRPLARTMCLALLATSTIACKTKIPADFEQLVPTEHRDKVELATQTDGSGYGADSMLIINYKAGVADSDLDAAYAKQIESAGYTELAKCEIEGQPASRDFIKAPAEHVQVFFRLPGDAENGPMIHVFRTAKLRELSGGEGCSFSDAAEQLCATLEADRCVLPE